jgi:hypothetical protein
LHHSTAREKCGTVVVSDLKTGAGKGAKKIGLWILRAAALDPPNV